MVLSEEAWGPAAGGHGDGEQGPEEGQFPGGSTPASLPPRPACHPGQGDRSDSFTVPRGSPSSIPKPLGTALSVRSRHPGLSFPSPTWQRSGPLGARAGGGLVFRADRNARQWTSKRVGRRREDPRPGRRRERRERGRGGGRGVARAPTSLPELGLQPQTRPPTQLKLGEIKGTTGRGWRRAKSRAVLRPKKKKKIAPSLGATEAELGQTRSSERARALLKTEGNGEVKFHSP